ncbi:MAG TPA: serine O-acetyltransferase, partial [Alphaproteobacteria bacterium]|nr:serine O-acetyltransferase [Alphaproteobacteria bacterium]
MRKTAASLWPLMRREARAQQAQNPLLASYLYASIVGHKSFSDSLCFVLANKLAEPSLGAVQFWELFSIAHAKD